MTFTVSAAEFALSVEKVAKLNKRAAKAGIPAVASLVEVSREVRKETTEFGLERVYEVVEVEVAGLEDVKLNGFKVAAVIDHDEAGNVLRTVPGFPVEVPAEYRTTAASRCDHCGKVRNRVETVLVWSEAEGFKQVGKQCVQLFLGVSASSLIAWLNDSTGGWSSNESWSRALGPNTAEFVAAASLVTAVYGFKPSSFSDSTVGMAWAVVNPPKNFSTLFPELARPGEAEVARANALSAEALAWVLDADSNGSDYLMNLKVAAKREAVGKNGGLLASLPNAYKRHMAGEAERAAKAAAKAAQPASAFQGVVGDKLTVEASVVYTNRSEGYSYYSPDSLFVILVATDGSVFHVNTTVETAVGMVFEDAARETVLKVTGTVKAHKVDNKGTEVTVLTRCKVAG